MKIILYLIDVTGFVLLFVLMHAYCTYYPAKHEKGTYHFITQVIVWSPKLLEQSLESFPEGFPPSRAYEDIFLTGDETTDNNHLGFAQKRLRKIINENDSIHGIHFRFGESMTYGTFIKVLNIMMVEEAGRYMPARNELWVINNKHHR